MIDIDAVDLRQVEQLVLSRLGDCNTFSVVCYPDLLPLLISAVIHQSERVQTDPHELAYEQWVSFTLQIGSRKHGDTSEGRQNRSDFDNHFVDRLIAELRIVAEYINGVSRHVDIKSQLQANGRQESLLQVMNKIKR